MNIEAFIDQTRTGAESGQQADSNRQHLQIAGDQDIGLAQMRHDCGPLDAHDCRDLPHPLCQPAIRAWPKHHGISMGHGATAQPRQRDTRAPRRQHGDPARNRGIGQIMNKISYPHHTFLPQFDPALTREPAGCSQHDDIFLRGRPAVAVARNMISAVAGGNPLAVASGAGAGRSVPTPRVMSPGPQERR